jgi:2-(1,2-epoxy-1,2-dihydrophenyl)acetyl-CoA isomerase
MAYETLLVEIDGPVGIITLNRPDAANALDLTMSQDLLAVASRCDSADVRAVILTGNGKMFCAGGDVLSFAAAGDGVTVDGGDDRFFRVEVAK